MKREQAPFYAIAAAVLVVGLLFAGVSPLFLFFLACPLMMIFMMRGMGHGGGNRDSDNPSENHEHSNGHHHSGR